jgi:general secretion pathway protein F
MPKYRYTAADWQGRPVSGELEAPGTEAAYAELAAAGLDVQSLAPVEAESPGRRRGWLSTEDTVELARGMADLARAGVPLAGGLRALAAELPHGRLRGVLGEISGQLERGATLDTVIQSQGSRFPAHLRGLILAGLRSGRLAEVLEEYVDLWRARGELRRRIWLSMTYPLVLVVAITLVLIVLQVGVVPAFAEIFDDFGVDLPVLTTFFLDVIGPATLLLGVLLILLAVVLLVSAAIPAVAWVGPWVHLVPLLGPLWRYGRLVQWARLTGMLLEQQVPLPEALRLSAAGAGDACLAEASRWAAAEVEAGRPLADCLMQRRPFPPSMTPLVDWGQQTGALGDAFRASAEMFEGRAQVQGVSLESVLLPVSLVMLAVFVGLFVSAMMLPLVSLIQSLT